jgi:hypothetical protein
MPEYAQSQAIFPRCSLDDDAVFDLPEHGIPPPDFY